MSGLDSLIEYQGFYDYINHFISGTVLIIGIETICKIYHFSLIQMSYTFIGLLPKTEGVNEFLWNVSVISLFALVAFLLGIVAQEVYSKIYNNKAYVPGEKESVKKSENSHKVLELFLSNGRRLFYKTTIQSCVENLLDENGPITNPYKRERYGKLKDEIIKCQNIKLPLSKEDTENYFFSYCVYYIQLKNHNRKTEKLRDIEGLSESLSFIFMILAFFSFAFALIDFYYTTYTFLSVEQIQFDANTFGALFAYSIVCAFLSIVMDCRTEKSIKNRIRMTLALYDVEKRESESEEQIRC